MVPNYLTDETCEKNRQKNLDPAGNFIRSDNIGANVLESNLYFTEYLRGRVPVTNVIFKGHMLTFLR